MHDLSTLWLEAERLAGRPLDRSIRPSSRPCAPVADRLALVLVTGFLGSGKTTLISALLRHPAMGETAVLVNELGEAAIDHHLVRQVDERTVAGQRLRVLHAARRPARRAARPARPARAGRGPAVRARGRDDWPRRPAPVLSTLLGEPVIATSTRSRPWSRRSTPSTARRRSTAIESVKQAALADTVLVTKADAAPAREVEALEARLRDLNPVAAMRRVSYGAVAPDVVLSARSRDAPLDRPGVPPAAAHAHDLRTFTLVLHEPLDWDAFAVWLTMLLHARAASTCCASRACWTSAARARCCSTASSTSCIRRATSTRGPTMTAARGSCSSRAGSSASRSRRRCARSPVADGRAARASYRGGVSDEPMRRGWVDLEGAVVNVRDLGGLPVESGGRTEPGVLVRADNLQGLTAADVGRLVDDLDVRVVVDTGSEVALEGPGPLVGDARVDIRHRSLYPEGGQRTDVAADDVLPWQGRRIDGDPDETPAVRIYLGYLRDRPDSIVSPRSRTSLAPRERRSCTAPPARTGRRRVARSRSTRSACRAPR